MRLMHRSKDLPVLCSCVSSLAVLPVGRNKTFPRRDGAMVSKASVTNNGTAWTPWQTRALVLLIIKDDLHSCCWWQCVLNHWDMPLGHYLPGLLLWWWLL